MREKERKKMQFGIIIGVMGFLIVVFFLFQSKNLYVKDYWKVIGFPNSHLYEDVLSVYGEPLDIDYEEKAATVIYNEITFIFLTQRRTLTDDTWFESVRFNDSSFRFGRKSIGVSSTREEVEKAYKNAKKLSGEECAYIDGFTWISFILDENDIVTEIMMSDGP